ncbi:alpha/beta fold hydrolase [Streptomyces sp. NPDC000618]|uniref:alpha/beta fold hydrolase n=1 Tax=Streptomyces sp. NPDC000618 TaxID=3154265 RepID=UPI003328D9B0
MADPAGRPSRYRPQRLGVPAVRHGGVRRAAVQTLDVADADRAALLGLSWGGIVALRVALTAPHRVSALVLSNTTARSVEFRERLAVRLNTLLIRSGIVPGGLGRPVVSGMLSEHSRNENPEFTTRLAQVVDALDKAGLARNVRSVLADRSSVVDALGRITAPALVIGGAEDRALPPTPHSTELADRIAGAQLEVVPRVAHLAPREAPTEVAALIRKFLGPLG